jgi:protein TonB
MLGLGILLALPLLYTEGLPTLKMIAMGVPLTAPAEAPRVSSEHPSTGIRATSNLSPLVVRRDFHPIGLPTTDPGSTDPTPCVGCLPAVGDVTGPFILNSIGVAPPPLPIKPKPVVNPPVISHMMEGNLIHQVQPNYPPLARAARVQGPVVLRAIISRAGTIENLQILSGHPLLTGAAIDAVRQWRYRPYILNGEAVEVETQVTVNFVLAGS